MPQRRMTLAVAGRPLRVRSVAKALLVTGLAAAALALFAMSTLPPAADQHSSADTRARSGGLLPSAAAQVLAAELALLVPKCWLTWLACVVASRTHCHTYPVIWGIIDGAGHGAGQVQGALNLSYWLFCVLQVAALAAFNVIAIFGEEY